MNSHLLPGDEGWPAEKALIAEMSSVNARLSRYVIRQLDVDAGRAEPIAADDERALGLRLVALGERVQRRAGLREAKANKPGLVIQGEARPSPAVEPNRQPGMDNGP